MTEAERALRSIRPLPNGEINHWTTDVPGWGISAPTVRQLAYMVRQWFRSETSDYINGLVEGCKP